LNRAALLARRTGQTYCGNRGSTLARPPNEISLPTAQGIVVTQNAGDAPTRAVRDTSADASVVPQALSLAILAVIADLWLEQHAGVSSSHTGSLATIITAIGLGPAVLEQLLKKRERSEIVVWIRKMLRAVLKTEIVAALWAIGLVVMLTRSSVEVVGGSPEDSGTVAVTPAAASAGTPISFGPKLEPARFTWMATNPFGRRYTVDVPGYVSASFVLFPIAGLRITLGKDLQPSPSVLFRPDPVVLSYLKSGGSRIRISVRHGAGLDSIAGGRGAQSFLLGNAHVIPSEMLQDWLLELGGVINEGSAETLLAWKHPLNLRIPSPFVPGTSLVAEVFSQGGNRVGLADVVLHTERLVDVEIPGGGERQP
jgi:hypothetical protein